MPSIPRLLARRIRATRTLPVLVIEGARAVGKTSLVRSELSTGEGFDYVDLSSTATRRDAESDLAGWLRRLPSPVVIDEAQLLPDLPVEVKRLVDETDRMIVLTGSSSIGRNTLGGADALAGRATRLRLDPLTLWEIGRHEGSIVDHLFESEPSAAWRSEYDEPALIRDLTVGGLPPFRVPRGLSTARERRQEIESYVDGVLGNSVLPDRGRDSLVALTILRALVCNPGGILNASKLGNTVDLDRRTVDRYVGMFQQLFLTHSLPNLALASSKQFHSRAKIHPSDTAVAAALHARAGGEIGPDRAFLGSLLESHVVNQILPAASWSSTAVDPFFWRKSSDRSPEVDLVLQDGTGRLVGVEVKLSSSVSSTDARGLLALRQDRGLHRGFVVYLGQDVRQLADDIWALPVEALATPRAWLSEAAPAALLPASADPLRQRATELTPNVDASLFVSYVHADNDHARGRILRFAQDVKSTYHALYGFEIDLFIDRNDILWGENWRTRLDREVSATTFLLSFVTPRYLTSEACRSEVLGFSAAAKAAGDVRLLLPLQWIDTRATGVVDPSDPVRKALEDSQYIDVTAVRRSEPGSSDWDDMVEEVVSRLRQSIEARTRLLATPTTAVPGARGGAEPDDSDVDALEALAALETGQAALAEKVVEFQHDLDALGAAMGSYVPPASQSPTAMIASFRALGDRLQPSVDALEQTTSALGDEWDSFNGSVQTVLRVSAGVPDLELTLKESLSAVADIPEMTELEPMREMLVTFGALSADLRPMSRAVDNALRLYKGIREAATGWLDQIH
ncbi:AAA family ATPase [Curtobacterium sp. MCSS17_015]|uniref:DUF4143 domain-containing protein n=1 Tax=Curtobacterium sp. MCSS17_015 TaxID=2175666 RepID=UPI0015E8E1C1|nr:AAA family ATPase [Curtobacterium sp. MCSS17_015]WIB26184.1 AAA family ATPase [Curtobacterium sp. MCSS17_015]